MLDKKQSQALFLFEFKMGHKTAATTHNIHSAFGPGTAKKYTVQWWFKKFGKGDESLEDEECGGQPLEVDNDQLEDRQTWQVEPVGYLPAFGSCCTLCMNMHFAFTLLCCHQDMFVFW